MNDIDFVNFVDTRFVLLRIINFIIEFKSVEVRKVGFVFILLLLLIIWIWVKYVKIFRNMCKFDSIVINVNV